MKLKVSIVFFLLCGGMLLQNCELEDDCNFGPVDEFFDIQNMSYAVFKTNTQFDCCDPIAVGDTIAFADLQRAEFIFEVEYVAENKFDFGLFGTLDACSPALPGSGGAKEESFTNIAIKTLNDFDAEHPAGSDISEFYSIDELFGGNDRPLPQFLTEQTGVTVQFEGYELFLQQTPENSGIFHTELTVTLSNGEVYTAQSVPFFLQN